MPRYRGKKVCAEYRQKGIVASKRSKNVPDTSPCDLGSLQIFLLPVLDGRSLSLPSEKSLAPAENRRNRQCREAHSGVLGCFSHPSDHAPTQLRAALVTRTPNTVEGP